MKFGDLAIGDLFNTLAARWVKIDKKRAIVVMSGVFAVGDVDKIAPGRDVIVLWTSKPGGVKSDAAIP